ncbi:HSF-type DNA-binding-domain-containing protein [Radiomyces spectabilis]|uniref:HSF-type DNA-binding-domain-containing protein n=1 Tax=Radiomyces spectabilis TaxID=64574 RepID=UPI00221EEA66|nr:HSF-type DNA-binding-domain-containing protein [Radiomyces spectabilis]KAI8371388.1 HSF-type DNA-binding-domain-containing protein [Radiomyces spectabilis]
MASGSSISGSPNSHHSNNPDEGSSRRMLEDPDMRHFITWSGMGDLFSVSNPTAFSKKVLPRYFKHNNWQSFVRQLNMYGFHKVNDMIHSNLTNENQTWEFRHPNFRRGRVDDLQKIKRKSPKAPTSSPARQVRVLDRTDSEDDMYMPLQKQLNNVEERVIGISQACQLLYSEMINVKQALSEQQQMLKTIVDLFSHQRPAEVDPLVKTDPQATSEAKLMSTVQCQSPTASLSGTSSIWSRVRHEGQTSQTSNCTSKSFDSPLQPPLPSVDVVRWRDNMDGVVSRTLTPPSGYRGTDDGRLHLPHPSQTEFPPTMTPTSAQTPGVGQSDPSKRTRTALMSFGKQSHLLNPLDVDDNDSRKDKYTKRRRKDHEYIP